MRKEKKGREVSKLGERERERRDEGGEGDDLDAHSIPSKALERDGREGAGETMGRRVVSLRKDPWPLAPE